LGIPRSPAFSQAFQYGYDLGINNSSLTREQINEYCDNNQILETENNPKNGLIIVGIRTILIVIALIITGISVGIWLIVRRRRATRKGIIEEASSWMSVEMTMNNRGLEEQDDWFTPKKVLAYCIIIGLISGTLSIFINLLIVFSVGAFVFASITVWYMFGEKLHRWEERRLDKKKRRETSI
jgi:hypothetical protein